MPPIIRSREWCLPLILAVIASYFLVWPVWRAFFPLEIGPTEGWNAYYQDAAFASSLYPPPDALTVNNYPPLSFYTVAALAWLLGDPLYVGRGLSILATLGIGAAVAAVVKRLSGGTIAAAVAGVWVVAIFVRSFNHYVGRDDPQLLAHFIMLAALVWFLHRDANGGSVLAPIVLMAVAGFFKHNIIAVPATVVIWLAMRDGRRAIAPAVVGVGAVAAGLAFCVALYGDRFLTNMLTPRAYDLGRIVRFAGRLQWVAPAIVLWALWAWSERQTKLARFTALYMGMALCACLLQWSGDAVLDNAQFDLVIAAAVGLGVAYERAGATGWGSRYGAQSIRVLVISVLALRLIATGRIEPALILFDSEYRALFPQHAAVVRQEAARIAALPGAVACDYALVCRMAGKQYVLDDFKTVELVTTRSLTQGGLEELLRQRGIARVSVGPKASAESLRRDLFHPDTSR
jgi:hypothetical protein